MKKLIAITILSILAIISSPAEAQRGCYFVSKGILVYNKKIGVMYGKIPVDGNIVEMRVSCTRGTPTLLPWKPDLVCTSDYINGRSPIGRSFSCLVRTIATKRG